MYKLATSPKKGGAKQEGELFAGEEEEEEGEGVVKKRIPQEGDSCPICCESYNSLSLHTDEFVEEEKWEADKFGIE